MRHVKLVWIFEGSQFVRKDSFLGNAFQSIQTSLGFSTHYTFDLFIFELVAFLELLVLVGRIVSF